MAIPADKSCVRRGQHPRRRGARQRAQDHRGSRGPASRRQDRSSRRSATTSRRSWTRPGSRPPASTRIKADLDRIAAVKTARELSRLFGEPASNRRSASTSAPTTRIPNAYFVNLVQSGLGLPDRDYYLKDDPKLKETRDAYLAHIGRMLTLAGVSRRRGQGRADHGARDQDRPGALGGRADA